MISRKDDDAQSHRAEIDAAGFDGMSAYFRESAESIADVRVSGIDVRIAEAVNTINAASRDAIRRASRTFQKTADELRRQHGI